MAKSLDKNLNISLPVIDVGRFLDVLYHLSCREPGYNFNLKFSRDEEDKGVLGINTHIYKDKKGAVQVKFEIGCSCGDNCVFHELTLNRGRKGRSKIPQYKLDAFQRIRESVEGYLSGENP
jgi:hypothetical protein